MNSPASDPISPSPAELAAAQTMLLTRRSANALNERLTAASALLRALDRLPAEPSLVFARAGDAKVEAAPIGAGITVGRGKDSTLCLDECADFSRRHFSVRPQHGAWLLEDLGSRNGTTVDGHDGRITRRLLCDGDIIFAGNLMFLFVNPAD